MSFSIAHLSDPHITTGSEAFLPKQGLSKALAAVLAINPLPDCVVITGDLVNAGRPDEYRVLRDVIAEFPLPVHLVPGNHDDPTALVAEFGGTRFLGDGKQTDYVVAYHGFRLVVLTSTVPDEPHGQLSASQLKWLELTLAEDQETATFVCVHHPPIRVGIPSLDAMGLYGADDMAEIVERHPNVVRVLSGHVHRPITGAFAGTVVSIAPSTWKQTALDLTGDDIDYSEDPRAFLLHVSTVAGWVTHTVSCA